jgi:hypothetical protein
MRMRPFAIAIATLYSLAGIGALFIGFVLPSDDPLAAVYVVLLSTPWIQLLSRLHRFAEGPAWVGIALATAAIALNAGLLWWWAMTRRRPAARA